MSIAFQEVRPAFQQQTAGSALGDRTPALPPELAFLREYGVRNELLRAAAREARRLGVDPREALLSGGGITDTLFYGSLAHVIDAPFCTKSTPLDPRADAHHAIHDGRVKLADGTWLLAPTGRVLRMLLDAARAPDLLPRNIAITTPAHLEAMTLHRAGNALARRASLALPSLRPALSAHGALDAHALVAATFVLLATSLLFLFAPTILAAIAGTLFLTAISFRWLVCVAGRSDERHDPGPLSSEVDADLPFYTVLVPLYGEAGMVPDLIRRLSALDYPAAKIEILILVEADDVATRLAMATAPKPPWMRAVVVPPGEPRTKPRALNVGLALARGELLAVFDAEDRPQPGQLREAAALYANAPPQLACLQGRLAITHGTRILPRLFAIEYAALFDLYNVGLARLRLPVALGGTSNHFRTSTLRELGGWDAWNVTEDADLGFRLARFGYETDVLVSTTFEEAPERASVWIRQRRRWTKGWMQVALVLLRDPSSWRDLGPARACAVALMLLNLVVGPLATPPVLVLAIYQLCRGELDGGTAMLALAVPLIAIISTVWCGWTGMQARRLGKLLTCLPLILPYQMLIAISAWGGLWDLVRRPYHWRKTPHGQEARIRPISRSSPVAPPRRRKGPQPATPG